MSLTQFVTIATLLVGQLHGVAAANAPINSPSPMAQPALSKCEQFVIAGVGQDCSAIAAAHGLSIVEFMLLNPSLEHITTCYRQLKPHYWYCVKAKPGATLGKPKPTEVKKPTKASTTKANPQMTAKKTSSKPRETKVLPTKTNQTKAKTTVQPPKTTSKPAIESVHRDNCHFGDCWYAFGTMSSKTNLEKLASASKMCSRLLTAGECKESNVLEFPGRINHFCKDCSTLSSACPCFLATHYHTRTWPDTMWTRAGLERGGGFLPGDH